MSIILIFSIGGCQTNHKKYSTDPTILKEGEKVFTTYCSSCHGIEKAGIGPKLGGTTKILAFEWLEKFVKRPKDVIDSGDARARKLFDKYGAYMPDFSFLTDQQLHAVLSYIDHETEVLKIPIIANDLDPDIENNRPDKKPSAEPVRPSGLVLEIEDFITLPPSSEHAPPVRISNMRPGPVSKNQIFVNDQRGIIYRIAGNEITTFLDIRSEIASFIDAPGLGTGLGSFAFHPDYLKNGAIYITHTEKYEGKTADFHYADSIKVAMQWVLSEWKMEDPTADVFKGTRRELLRINVPSGIHGVQDMNFVPEVKPGDKEYGMLYIGIGDAGSTIGGFPQLCHSLNSFLGTIIRIDPQGNNSPNGQYGIPRDNPYYESKDPNTRKEIWAYGFRNPHRISWTGTSDRKLVVADVGELSFEELNIVEPGKDYGWNVREGNYQIDPFDLSNVSPLTEKDTVYQYPFAQYDHYAGQAICGGHTYDGQIAKLKGKYIFGDIVSGKLFYTERIENSSVMAPVYELSVQYKGIETDLKKIVNNQRVDLRIGEDHFKNLYIMSKADGKIRKIKDVSMSAQ
ncbi:PQQ-dependent sugar dehydrogenase [Fulvivirgaceae bacterium BMA10]|uniref:PQQ-dependent sugar dehydrogenase n=1 Tax=Splendidivirga corallicola TaxID=3051826 RepID=A0ABT8KTV7_9BACT|nr:PQQ-dependent sugar dehydrogenase [Fulvivirgaceae bacterium BMA10]